MKKEFIYIDSQKLRECLHRKNFTQVGISKICGYSQNWMSQILKKGTITTFGAKSLELVTGIKLEEYRLADKTFVNQQVD